MKKWLCLVASIVLCLGISSMSFAASLTDIKGTKYEDAVENLIEVGLVNGFEDNTYRPNVAVTRAQMAKLMVIALGEEGKVDYASLQSTTFTDMNSNHWAYGYVNVAKDIGVINGYTDGSFDPDATVSYAEATTMVVRALGYEDKVAQISEAWPNNYISCAKDLELFENISTFDNNTGAARGDIAILLWNTLNTGVCKVVAQNDKGLVYGEGELMLSKYKNYIYMSDGVITDVDFDDDFENATVTITGKEKIKVSMSDTDVIKYLGKEITLLYNENTKKILDIYALKKYKEDTGDITKLTSKKIYIDDEEYTLPDKNSIFLYKVDDIDDAIEATVYLDGKTVKYVLAQGARKVEVAMVTKNNVKVNKEEGVTLKKIGSSSTTSYALIDAKKMPDKYSVIFYYLNADDEIGILQEVSEEDAKKISSLSTLKIKVGTKTYEYDSKNYEVYSATTSNFKTLAFRNIDEDDDLAYVYEHGGKTYVVVFEDAAEDESNKSSLYKDLTKYIDNVKSEESKESRYSQETFAKFIEALEDARAIKSTATTAKINSAMEDLKTAYDDLKTVSATSKEGKVVSKRAELRALINGKAKTVVNDKAKYTSDTYNTFNNKLTAANKLLKETDNTLSEVTEAYDDLNNAINKLVLVANTQEYKDALAALNAAINRSSSLSSKDSYTEASYNNYKTAYDAAVLIKNNAATKTASDMKLATQKLNDAIDNLQLALDTVKDDLNALIVESIDKIESEDDYTPETYAAFEKVYDNARKVSQGTDLNAIKQALTDLKKAKDALKLVDDELNDIIKAVEKMKTAKNVAEALNMSAQKPSDKLNKINNIKKAVRQDLEDVIQLANAKANEEGADGDGSLNIAIGNAKKVLSSNSSTIANLVSAYDNLNSLVK
ncbi:MAG: S-layer homology domain-containing protein [Clostridia bacterium]|nr:S-layer homology domain-containing protein [Clostridia bacterium]